MEARKYSDGSDYVSAVKMNYLHYFLKNLMGYLLHPTIEGVDRVGFRVADLGSQTGTWSVDFAETYPSSLITAFDRQSKFMPHPAWLPENLRFVLHDIDKPFDEAVAHTFDVVHLRMFLNKTKEEVSAMLKNATTLLRPGGYVQWVEHDKTDLETVSVAPGLPTESIEALHALEKEPFPGYRYRWVEDIAPTMKEQGLVVLAENKIKVRPSMYSQMANMHLLSFLDVPDGASSTIDSFKEKHLSGLQREVQLGSASVDGFRVVVAQMSS